MSHQNISHPHPSCREKWEELTNRSMEVPLSSGRKKYVPKKSALSVTRKVRPKLKQYLNSSKHRYHEFNFLDSLEQEFSKGSTYKEHGDKLRRISTKITKPHVNLSPESEIINWPTETDDSELEGRSATRQNRNFSLHNYTPKVINSAQKIDKKKHFINNFDEDSIKDYSSAMKKGIELEHKLKEISERFKIAKSNYNKEIKLFGSANCIYASDEYFLEYKKSTKQHKIIKNIKMWDTSNAKLSTQNEVSTKSTSFSKKEFNV